jgi:hypothetical protein
MPSLRSNEDGHAGNTAKLTLEVKNGGVAQMPSSLINEPEYWRARAEEIRALADDMKNPDAQKTMLKVADDYDRLAKRAEARAVGLMHSGQPGPMSSLGP